MQQSGIPTSRASRPAKKTAITVTTRVTSMFNCHIPFQDTYGKEEWPKQSHCRTNILNPKPQDPQHPAQERAGELEAWAQQQWLLRPCIRNHEGHRRHNHHHHHHHRQKTSSEKVAIKRLGFVAGSCSGTALQKLLQSFLSKKNEWCGGFVLQHLAH